MTQRNGVIEWYRPKSERMFLSEGESPVAMPGFCSFGAPLRGDCKSWVKRAMSL
jgi:hypothetical protein